MTTNPTAAHLRAEAEKLAGQAGTRSQRRRDAQAATYRMAADEIERLHEGWEASLVKRSEPQFVTFYGGPVHGANPRLRSQPARIEIAGRYVYVRVDDPDTGESLDFYAYIEEN